MQMKSLRKLDRIINLFRQMDHTIPAQVISVFLAIARKEGREPLESRLIPEMVGLSHAATQRALTYLGDTHWKDKKQPGLKLIVQRVHPEDARQRVVELSTKGKHLCSQIEEIMDDGAREVA